MRILDRPEVDAPSNNLPLMTMLHENHAHGVLVTFGLVICGTITYYVILIYMPTFAQHAAQDSAPAMPSRCRSLRCW
jgi:hypothetical protein